MNRTHNLTRLILPLLVLSLIHLSCGTVYSTTAKAVSFNTIDQKLASLPYGTSREKFIEECGPPHYMATIKHENDLIEIFEYEWGNYWYHEMPIVVFKNGKLIGSVPHTYELLKLLATLRVMPPASFWQLRDDVIQDQASKTK